MVFCYSCNNQPCSNAFLAEQGVISMMMMTRMRTTMITVNNDNKENHNEDDNNMNVNDDLVF